LWHSRSQQGTLCRFYAHPRPRGWAAITIKNLGYNASKVIMNGLILSMPCLNVNDIQMQSEPLSITCGVITGTLRNPLWFWKSSRGNIKVIYFVVAAWTMDTKLRKIYWLNKGWAFSFS
jgi:hypothetical protein